MGLLSLLLGRRCPSCSVRTKGAIHKFGNDEWRCHLCHEKAEAEKRQQSPDYQLDNILPPLLTVVGSRSDAKAVEKLERLCSRFEYEWKGAHIDWEVKARAEDLLLSALESPSCDVRRVVARLLMSMGFVPSVPKLIELLEQKLLAPHAWAAIAQIRKYFDGGWGTCPRCGSTRTEEGNATGWRCMNCELRYKPHGSRDPLAFLVSGGFHGSPLNRKEISDLLDEVLKLRGPASDATLEPDTARSFAQRAEAIAAKRIMILQKLTE